MDILKEAGFDFDELARLADADPAGFARRRAELIQSLIGKSSRPVDLANLQLELDATRYCRAPGAASGLEMIRRMLENVQYLNGCATRLRDLIEDEREPPSGNAKGHA